MSPALEVQIRARWPGWFGNYSDYTKSLMGHGFQCSDGWYQLLVQTFERIEPHVIAFNREPAEIGTQFEILEVKEKFGTLRVISSGTNERIIFAFLHARDLSSEICAECGAPGKLRTEYLQTLCAVCWSEREYGS